MASFPSFSAQIWQIIAVAFFYFLAIPIAENKTRNPWHEKDDIEKSGILIRSCARSQASILIKHCWPRTRP
jgi:hypothetical protein